MTTFILPANEATPKVLFDFIHSLKTDRAWKITVEEYKPRRTHDQNAYLWACYRVIQKQLEGWDVDDVHEFFLGECFGWETIKGLGGIRQRPVKHSSTLSIEEFSKYIEFVQRKAAEHGIYIPDPE